MPARDKRIDAYIAKSPDFAQPILAHIREVVHSACPDVNETLKWSAPAYEHFGILCITAAFKKHAALVIWKGSLIFGKDKAGKEAMGHFGRLTKVSDLPSKKVLIGYLKQAMKLNEERVQTPRAKPAGPKKPATMPAYLKVALAKNKKAKTTFDGFSPSHKREYIQWLTEAKTEATRTRRLATAIEWMSEGKPRMWKYMRK
jgi:uncharacterized protein YdeI (YjbR/CyaY-like superfamily)